MTGGYPYTYTTEVYDPLVGSWVVSGANLPHILDEPRAANINGRVLIFGNDNPKSFIYSSKSSRLAFSWHLIITNTWYPSNTLCRWLWRRPECFWWHPGVWPGGGHHDPCGPHDEGQVEPCSQCGSGWGLPPVVHVLNVDVKGFAWQFRFHNKASNYQFGQYKQIVLHLRHLVTDLLIYKRTWSYYYALMPWHVSWSHTILPSISQAIFSKWILVQGLSNSNFESYTPQLIIMTTAVAFPTSHTMENNTDYNSLPPNLPSSGIYELWPKGI